MDQSLPAAGEVPSRITTKRYDLGVVTKIEAHGPGTLLLARGARGAVAVSAMPEDHERVEVKADGDTLKLSFHGGRVLNRGPEGDIRYEVTAAAGIEELKLGGGIAAEAVGLEGREIKVKLDGGSRLTLSDLRATEFELDANGGSQSVATGTVERQKVKLSGGSSYQGMGLGSQVAEVEASGGSEGSVRAGQELKVRASAGSSVAYAGEGLKLDVKTDGGSNLRQVATA